MYYFVNYMLLYIIPLNSSYLLVCISETYYDTFGYYIKNSLCIYSTRLYIHIICWKFLYEVVNSVHRLMRPDDRFLHFYSVNKRRIFYLPMIFVNISQKHQINRKFTSNKPQLDLVDNDYVLWFMKHMK